MLTRQEVLNHLTMRTEDIDACNQSTDVSDLLRHDFEVGVFGVIESLQTKHDEFETGLEVLRRWCREEDVGIAECDSSTEAQTYQKWMEKMSSKQSPMKETPIHLPSAADLPRPRPAVRDTVERRPLSETASKKVMIARA